MSCLLNITCNSQFVTYVREVIFPIVFVTALSLPIALYTSMQEQEDIIDCFLFILFVPIMCCIIYVCGTCKSEKKRMVMRTIRTKFLKRKIVVFCW